jgi:hypothetical protein
MARPADDPLFTDAGVQDALLALAAERLRATPEARWAEALEAYRTRERSWSETAQAFVARAATARPGVAFTG